MLGEAITGIFRPRLFFSPKIVKGRPVSAKGEMLFVFRSGECIRWKFRVTCSDALDIHADGAASQCAENIVSAVAEAKM